jgi:hypothetical protein
LERTCALTPVERLAGVYSNEERKRRIVVNLEMRCAERALAKVVEGRAELFP